MNFAIDCCCSRKPNKSDHEMSERRKQEIIQFNNNLSDIHELVMTPCENVQDMPETFSNNIELPDTRKKVGVYLNFFEDDETPRTPRTPDINKNTINLSIPKGCEIYVNYEKYNFT